MHRAVDITAGNSWDEGQSNKQKAGQEPWGQMIGKELERLFCTESLCYSLRQHLRHVCGNTRSPVSSLYVVLLEAQPVHQLVKYPSSCYGVKACQ